MRVRVPPPAPTSDRRNSVYGLKPQELALAVGMLMEHEHLTIQDADVVEAALRKFRVRRSGGFTGCLVLALAAKAGHLPLGTFDRQLARLGDAQLV